MLIVSRAPLRISLAGGGTDQPEYYLQPNKASHVISLAINKYLWVTLSERWEKEVFVAYRQQEEVHGLRLIKHKLIQEALRRYDMPQGHIESHIIANMSGNGTGLGSSSALSVALVRACTYWHRQAVDDWAMTTRHAWELERQANNSKVGIQDHAAAASNGAYHFTFSEMGYRRQPFYPYELIHYLLCFELPERATAASGILATMAEHVSDNESCLDALSNQAQAMERAIGQKCWTEVGRLLDEGWQTKKCLNSFITTPAIDEIYSEVKALGALGGKVCGAGNGGFLLVFAEPERQHGIRNWLTAKRIRELKFSASTPGDSTYQL